MAAQKPTIPKGTRDFGPAEVQRRKHILTTIESVFTKYGFMPIETPVMENLSTLQGKYGDEGDQLLYRVLDSGEFLKNIDESFINQGIQLIVNDSIDSTLREVIWEITRKLNYEEIYDFAKVQKFIVEFLETYPGNIFNIPLKKHGHNVDEILKGLTDWLGIEIAFALRKSSIPLGPNLDPEQFDWFYKQFKINVLNPILVPNVLRALDSNSTSKFIAEKGLRYDLTVPFARYVVMHRNDIVFPFRRYQMQPVWRADRPQKGRYREFWQCDADVIGSNSLLNEIDLVQVYHDAFIALGLNEYKLKVNSRKVLSGIAEVVKGKEFLVPVSVAIDKLDKAGEVIVRNELMQQGFTDTELDTLFDIITTEGDNNTLLSDLRQKLASSAEGLQGIDELSFVVSSIADIGCKANLQVDFSLARGLSYYTGCIFEVVAGEGSLSSSIGGGGRYDNLTGNFGLPDVSGVGISFGLDRIYDVLEELSRFPKTLKGTPTTLLFCSFDKASLAMAMKLSRECREAGIACEVYPDLKKIGKQLDYANALQIPFACVIGETELTSGMLQLKDLASGSQLQVTAGDMIGLLKAKANKT